jgi:hypothetical protein
LQIGAFGLKKINKNVFMEDYNMIINWIWITKNLLIFLYLVFYFLTTKWLSNYILKHESFNEMVLNNYAKPFSENIVRNFLFFIVCVIGIIVACVQLSIGFIIFTGGAGGINLSILTLFISIPYGIIILIKQLYLNNKVNSKG